jgi:subtilisin family serine protease
VVIERLAYDGGDPGDTYPQEGIDDGHGTYVATFLAGQVNGWGGAGLWPRAKIVSVRVFPPGAKRTTAKRYIEGLRRCRQDPHVKVINLSLNDIDADDADLAALRDRIADYRQTADINVVVAAGNRAGRVEVPARFDEAFAVGAGSSAGGLCTFSARGPGLDIVAPGCSLEGSDQRGQPASFDGTSFAAPIVAGALASLRAYRGFHAEGAERQLLATARQSADAPVLDVREALSPMDFSSSAMPPAPIVGSDEAVSTNPDASVFVDYSRPRFATRTGQRGLRVRVRNRPAEADIQIRTGNRDRETKYSIFWIRPESRPRIRFISDKGVSRWVVVTHRGLRR